MYIKSIRIDGFGPWSNLTLEGLSEGLNVFFGPPGAGKSMLRRFVRTVLTGFGEAPPTVQASPDHAVIGGSLSTVTSAGRFEISRYSDGTRQGRLVIRSADGTLQDPALLASLRQLPAATFDCLLDVDFHGRPSLNRLLDLLAGGGLLSGRAEGTPIEPAVGLPRELEAARQALREHEQSPAAARLDRRRAELTRQIARLGSRDGHPLLPDPTKIDHWTRQVQRRTADVQRIQAQLDQLRQQEAAWRTTSRQADRSTPPPGAERADVTAVLRQLEALDEQVRRWRRVEQDVQKRDESLRDELRQWQLNQARPAAASRSPRSRLAQLERQVTQLQGQLASLQTAALHGCACRGTLDTLGPLAEQLRQQLYQLCQELTAQQRGVRHDAVVNELKQLRRCRQELAAHIGRLTQRRQELLAQYGRLDPAGLELFRRAEAGQCDCDRHAEYLDSQRQPPRTVAEPDATGASSATGERSRELRLAELARRGDKLSAELSSAEQRLRKARQRLAAARRRSPATSVPVGASELAEARRQLQSVERKLESHTHQHHQLRAEVERLEQLVAGTVASAHPDRSPQLLPLVSSYLRRISSGKYVRATGPGSDGLLWITAHDGQTYPHDVLGPRTYDQLYLSLRLALADIHAQQNIRIPLVLDEPFLNVDVVQHPELLQVLSSFAAAGHQVFVLTADPSAARLLSEQDHWVRDLPQLERSSASPAETAHAPARVVTGRSDWDPEEFPGELSDRVRVAAERVRMAAERARQDQPILHTATGDVMERPWSQPRQQLTRLLEGHDSTDHATSAGKSPANPNDVAGSWKFYLETSSPIEDAPSIGRKMAAQLRAIGVTQVSDLLALSPRTAATQLAHLTVPSDAIRAWQAQAWLVCCVPYLRPYDARILVACGITDPDQLQQMDPHELLQRVERFLATREGAQIVQSGNDYELARITHWIHMARQAHLRRQRQAAAQARRNSAATAAHARSARPRPYANPPLADLPAASPHERLPLDPAEAMRPRLWADDETAAADGRRFHLHSTSPVVDAPSIGPKLADRLGTLGIRTVADLLAASPAETARRLDHPRIKAATVRAWQHQARLVCRVPHLRGHDAQLLVACGYTEPEQLRLLTAEQLLAAIQPVVDSPAGQRILRTGKRPDLEEVAAWIRWSHEPRSPQAA